MDEWGYSRNYLKFLAGLDYVNTHTGDLGIKCESKLVKRNKNE